MNFVPNIIYEDDVILVCNKPAGLMVEPDRNNHPNLLQQVKQYLINKTNLKAVYVQHLHRLDRPVSGIVLFVKQKELLRNLSEQFAQREVLKNYIAYTDFKPSITTNSLAFTEFVCIEQWHRKEKKKAVIVAEGTPFAKKIKLEYHITPQENMNRIDIKLHTGKFHQIRAQLSSVGYPIIGDEKYGSKTPYKPNAIALHASLLSIKHPVLLKEMIFESEFSF